MKQNLISIVKSILSDMDSEDVNSLDDSVEAQQIASIVRDTFYNITATRETPEFKEVIKLVAASDIDYPTHFEYGTNVKEVEKVWYTNDEDRYYEVQWREPLDFLRLADSAYNGVDHTVVYSKPNGTRLYIRNNAPPRFYTSFDEYHIVMDSYDVTLENTLQEVKSRAYGTVFPHFEMSDHYTPELDATMFPYLIAEAKSTAMSLLKGQSDPKVEQNARRQKNFIQNDRYRTKKTPHLVAYGRRGPWYR